MIQEPIKEAGQIAEETIRQKKHAFLLGNNRLEGIAPVKIEAVVASIDRKNILWGRRRSRSDGMQAEGLGVGHLANGLFVVGGFPDLLPPDWSIWYESHSRPFGQEDFR